MDVEAQYLGVLQRAKSVDFGVVVQASVLHSQAADDIAKMSVLL